jgi:hypothetical protein
LQIAVGVIGPVAVSIGASSTGIFTDATDTYTAATTDGTNYKVTTGTTGTSISVSHLSVWANISAQVATERKYQHFDLTARQIGRQNYNPFGAGELVIFG